MEGTFLYMLIANQALVHKKLPAYLKDTGLTIGQPKVLEYLSEHDGSNQTEIARIFSRVLHFLPGVLFGDRREEEPEDIREGGAGFVVAIGREYGSGGRENRPQACRSAGYAFYDDEIIRRAAGTTGIQHEARGGAGGEHDQRRPLRPADADVHLCPRSGIPQGRGLCCGARHHSGRGPQGQLRHCGPLLRLDSARRSPLPARLDPGLGAGPHCPHHGVRSLRRPCRPGHHGQGGPPARHLLSVLHPPRLGPGPQLPPCGRQPRSATTTPGKPLPGPSKRSRAPWTSKPDPSAPAAQNKNSTPVSARCPCFTLGAMISQEMPLSRKTAVNQSIHRCLIWLRRLDLNQRPSGYEPDELPTAPLRDIFLCISRMQELL